MEDMFTCDSCGQEFPRAKMKEAFREEGRERIKEELCPSCLDKRMKEAAEVKGVVGEEKAAAVRLTDGSADMYTDEHESIGARD